MNLERTPTFKSSKIRVALTLGDPSGIGPIIILKALRKLKTLAEFIVIADKWVIEKAHNLEFQHAGRQTRIPRFNLVDLKNISHKNFQFGKVKAEYGKAAIEYLDCALGLIKKREVDCLVTCPLSKEAVNLAGFKGFRGHTEYLAKYSNTKDFVMLLLNNRLKISLVTTHLALGKVPLAINKDKLCRNILITERSLRRLFSLSRPRLVVAGLNPHASDNGLLGEEENKIILPALKRLKNKIGKIDGPLSADVAIAKAYAGSYDCVIAMYHDQALIPLKLLGGESGVNLTLGLPFVRTSPLHGTGFDIAQNPHKADPSSLIAAIKLAVKCTLNLKKA